jgi:Tfp pilus assembly ATPase PilU
VFGAGIFAYANYLNEREITEIINDENPHDFVFENDKFIWKDLSADTESISNARSGFVTTFGSCSFEEPRGDLKALGMF